MREPTAEQLADTPPAETGSAAPEEEIIKTFRFFRDAEGAERTVVVKHLGAFKELLKAHGKEQTRESPAEEGFKEAREIIEVFRAARISQELPDDSTVVRRPHLLIAGGFVRDALMSLRPHDIDFATNLTHAEAEKLLRAHFSSALEAGAMTIKKEGKSFGVLHVYFRRTSHEYQIATFREDIPAEEGAKRQSVGFVRHARRDADRRDLTINALFYNPLTGNVIDYVGGIQDIKNRVLRFVGNAEERITEEPNRTRMLRYIRFLVRTGFAEDVEAKAAIQRHAAEIAGQPMEPIREEFEKIFAAGKTGTALELLREYRLLEHLFPEVLELERCAQGPPYHMEGHAFRHTVLVANGIPAESSPELHWSAIFHDVGKLETRAVEQDKQGNAKVSFRGHAPISAQKAEVILARLKMPGVPTKKILWLIAEHIRALEFSTMREGKARELAASPHFAELLQLAQADTNGSWAATEELSQGNAASIAAAKKRFAEFRRFDEQHAGALKEVEKAINGNVIIALYTDIHGAKPRGPLVGVIAREIKAVIAEERITDPDTAVRRLKEVIAAQQPKG